MTTQQSTLLLHGFPLKHLLLGMRQEQTNPLQTGNPQAEEGQKVSRGFGGVVAHFFTPPWQKQMNFQLNFAVLRNPQVEKFVLEQVLDDFSWGSMVVS